MLHAEKGRVVKTSVEYPDQGTITLQRTGVMTSYIGESYKWGMFQAADGTILYSTRLGTDWAQPGQLLYPIVEQDNGLLYIVTHGYPASSLLGTTDVDRFITQAAIWMYEDKGQIHDNFLNGSDPYGIMDEYILPLAETASKITSQAEIIEPVATIENGAMSHDKNDFFILHSPKITVDIDDGAIATISLSGYNDSGHYIIDEQGDHRTQFSDNESFYVEIPWVDCLLNREIDVTVEGDVTLPRAIEYRTSLEGNYERLVGLKEVTAKVTTTVPLPMSVDLAIADYSVMSIGLLVAVGAIITACHALFKRHEKKGNGGSDVSNCK